jgi:hypothetical protein
MSDIHTCSKASTIDDIDTRVIEMETTLFGAARNGGGFIKETRETLEVVRKGVDTLSGDIRDLRYTLKGMRGFKAWVKVTLPPVLTAAAAVAAVVLAK